MTWPAVLEVMMMPANDAVPPVPVAALALVKFLTVLPVMLLIPLDARTPTMILPVEVPVAVKFAIRLLVIATFVEAELDAIPATSALAPLLMLLATVELPMVLPVTK